MGWKTWGCLSIKVPSNSACAYYTVGRRDRTSIEVRQSRVQSVIQITSSAHREPLLPSSMTMMTETGFCTENSTHQILDDHPFPDTNVRYSESMPDANRTMACSFVTTTTVYDSLCCKYTLPNLYVQFSFPDQRQPRPQFPSRPTNGSTSSLPA